MTDVACKSPFRSPRIITCLLFAVNRKCVRVECRRFTRRWHKAGVSRTAPNAGILNYACLRVGIIRRANSDVFSTHRRRLVVPIFALPDRWRRTMKHGNSIHRHGMYLNHLCRNLFLALLLLGAKAYAQDAPANAGASQGGDTTTQNADPDADTANTGPVRMARFSLVTGSVTWRADSGLDWSPAAINLPIRQGAQVYVPVGARAEVQFDDGSVMHLGGDA